MSSGIDDTPDLAARLARLPDADRNYLLRYLPLHLDAAGDDVSIQRLLRLPRDGFPRLKAELTHDANESNLDYRYYFRAALRARDLPAALRLGRTRASLSRLSDWLASGVVAGLLPHLGSGSTLWAQVQHAVAAIDHPTLRVERLTSILQPGLDREMRDWMRREFDRAAAHARDSARTDFLAAVASTEPGTLDYVLTHAASAPMNEAFARALVRHVHRLCEGTRSTMAQAFARIAPLARGHREAFVAAVDLLAALDDRETAREGIAAFEAVLPESGDTPDALSCIAAVSHAWTAQGDRDRAEPLAKRCLEIVPPIQDDETMRLLYSRPSVEAAGRLLLAAAPFTPLWMDAVERARELAARGTGRSHQSDALARFLRVTPWIADAGIRIAWLRDMLGRIEAFADSDLDSESTDALDLSLTLRKRLDGVSPRQQLSKPIMEALLDVAGDIDRVLAAPNEPRPFVQIVSAIAEVNHRIVDDQEGPFGLITRLLGAAGRSTNAAVRLIAVEAFLTMTSKHPYVEAAITFGSSLPALVGDLDKVGENEAAMLAHGALESAERAWGDGRPEMRLALAHAALRAAIASRHAILFDAIESVLPRWFERIDPDEWNDLVIRWAAARARFGRAAESTRMLDVIDTTDPQTRLQVAEALFEAGSVDAAAAMVAGDVPSAVDFDDMDAAEWSMRIARLLVRANGDAKAVKFLVDAASTYRARIGDVDDDAEIVVLNAVRALRVEPLIAGLLERAEYELMDSAEADASAAARWYVAVALAAIGNRDAANRVRGQIAQWEDDRRGATVRAHAAALLDAPSPMPACAELLEAVAGGKTSKRTEARLKLLCRLMPHLDREIRVMLIDGIAHIASTIDARWSQARVLAALCEALSGELEVAVAAHGLEAVLAAMEPLPPPRRDGDSAALVDAIVGAAKAHRLDVGSHEQALLVHVCHAESDTSDAARFRELIVDVTGIGLRTALDATTRIADASSRWPFVQAIANAAVQRDDAAVRDDALAMLIALFDSYPEPSPFDIARLADIYASCLSVAPRITADMEARLRAAGPPASARGIIEWKSHLAGTPLQRLAVSAFADLRNDLDRFARHPSDLRMLQDFLRDAPNSASDAVTLIEKTAAWAATMPLVTREDWRHDAFTRTLLVTAYLDTAARRPAVQMRIVELAASALPPAHWGWKHLRESLVTFPFDPETSRRALACWLPADSFDKESIADLFVDSVRYRSHDATPAVVDAFIERIGDFFPSRLNREAAAAALRDATCPALREYLRTRLLHDYDNNGLGALTEPELIFLATMPLEWWQERSTSADLEAARLPLLHTWIERAVRHDVKSAWWAVLLATEWLSRSDPRALPDFYLELCTLPAWFPRDVRDMLLDAARS